LEGEMTEYVTEYVTEKPKAVCVECKFEVTREWEWLNRTGVAHDCHGSLWSTVTGEIVVRPCGDANDGNCPHYEAKP